MGATSPSEVNRFVALVRGINVSGHKSVMMKDLRALMETLGAEDVATYLQSGNVVFRPADTDPDAWARAIEAKIRYQLGYDVAVLVRTAHELARVAAENPFISGGEDGARLYVTFLGAAPDPERATALGAGTAAGTADSFRLHERHVYLHCPGGYGRSTLNNAFFEKKLAVAATTRNWRTVTTLAEMAQ